jgi:flagellar FliL protein
MSDSDELDIDGGEAPDASTSKKKKGGLGALLPTILKFAAIGIGAIIFIVTVCIITVGAINKGGKPQTVTTDTNSAYVASLPILTYYTDIGKITTLTSDNPPWMVEVVMNLGYDPKNTEAASELNGRKFELQEFTRKFFAQKSVEELQIRNEERLKREIMEELNNRYFQTAKILNITITTLSIMESSF